MKRQVDGLHPTIRPLKGDYPIELLSFLATIQDALDTTGATEAMGIRVLAYYLEEEAEEVHKEQVNLVTDDP